MNNCKFHTAGNTAALDYAIRFLKNTGYPVVARPEDATHLLLPVPSFEPDGRIKGGGTLDTLLSTLPQGITILGGNLDRPELAAWDTVDLLKDPYYLARNANITAHCAIKLAMTKLPVTLEDQPVLIIGWGRIGKSLARLLRQLGAEVTVAARKEPDRAMLSALGYKTADTAQLDTIPFRVIFNTVPHTVSQFSPGDALKIDLASSLGLGGPDVIWARGLPSKDAPESSGELIARTAIRIAAGKESVT